MDTEEVERLFVQAFMYENPIFGERYAHGIFQDWLVAVEQNADKTGQDEIEEAYTRGYQEGYEHGYVVGSDGRNE